MPCPPDPSPQAVPLLASDDAFFENNPFPCFVVQAGGGIVRVNARFTQATGYELVDVEGRQIETLLSRANAAEVYDYHREKLRHRDRPFEYECNIVCKDEHEIRVVLTMNIVTRGGYGLGSLRDVTEERRLSAEVQARNLQLQQSGERLREAQEELNRATQLATLGEVSGQMAHELLNPLTAALARVQKLGDTTHAIHEILTYYRDILKGVEGTVAPDVAESLSAVGDALEEQLVQSTSTTSFVTSELGRIQRLVDDMRGATKTALRHTILDLHDLLKYCRDVMTEPLDRAKVACIFDVPANVQVNGDRGELIQVFTNLMRNAIEAIPAQHGDRRVRVRALVAGSVVNVDVTDSGTGIPTEVADMIFEPKFTTKREGTGLGLAIARRLVRACGGDLMLTRATDLDGAQFTVRLPCSVQTVVDWEG